jgi:hypothetical protein
MALYAMNPTSLSGGSFAVAQGYFRMSGSTLALSATGGSVYTAQDANGFRLRFRRQRTPSNPTVEWNRELEIATNGYTTDVTVPVPFKSQQHNAVLFGS